MASTSSSSLTHPQPAEAAAHVAQPARVGAPQAAVVRVRQGARLVAEDRLLAQGRRGRGGRLGEQPLLPLARHQLEAGGLLAHLLEEARVGDDRRLVPPDHQRGVLAAKAGQVAHVGAVADDDGVQAQVAQQQTGPLESFWMGRHDASFPLISASLSTASRYPSTPFPLTRSGDDAVQHRVPTELLALLDVGEMDLGDGSAHHLERVPDRVAVVRPGAGVDDHRAGALHGQAVQLLDHLALEVRLEGPDLEAAPLGVTRDRALELDQRLRPVLRRVTPPEHVEVDAVQHPQDVAHPASHSTTS